MRSERYFAAIVFLAFFGVAACLPSHGQSRTNSTGTGGLHQIRGRVYLPNGKSLDTPIRVELQSTTHGTLNVETDRSGSFAFGSLAPGNYAVVISAGDSFETTREYVTIDAEVQGRSTMRVPDRPKTIMVPMYLQAKRGEVYKTGVINAKWASVPKPAVESYEKGIELERAGKSAEAVLEFRKSVDLHPPFAPSHAELGKIYLKTGRLDDAVNEFRTASRFDPADFDSKLNCGVALLNKLDFASAEKDLKEAAELNKTAVMPHYYLGRVFLQTDDLNGAQREMEAARALAGTNEFAPIHKYLGGIYWKKGSTATVPDDQKTFYKQAVDELEKYVKLLPKAQDVGRIKETIAQLRGKLG
jgi:hypothetical protein